MQTTIIPSFPGYYQCDGIVVYWAPVPRVYSPPLLHIGVRLRLMDIGHVSPRLIALLIGSHGYHFKKFTEWSGALYLFVRGQTIEVWGFGNSVERAMHLLIERAEMLIERNARQAPFRGQQQMMIMAAPPAF